mmetsp:Transcript_2642/g.6087  ORF Transcript_2642/g.6087 Transcript_2642/m.6087 type:complete len:174 (-) Transcript_2642:303-824(-)
MNAFQHIDETQADIAKAAVDEAKAASDSSSSATSDADASYLENSSETAINDMAAERQPQQQNQQQQQEERAPVFDVRSVNTRGSILRLIKAMLSTTGIPIRGYIVRAQRGRLSKVAMFIESQLYKASTCLEDYANLNTLGQRCQGALTAYFVYQSQVNPSGAARHVPRSLSEI